MELIEYLYFLDGDALQSVAKEKRASYLAADPFPHLVVDNLLPSTVAQKLLASFPGPSFARYKQPDNAFQVNKLGRLQEEKFKDVPAFARHMLNEFNGINFIDFLETLTGISGLIPDPHLHGGAFHQILRGGKLAVHADFNRDPRRKLDRRVNVLFYLNPDWEDRFGGHLELWDKHMKRCEVKVAPIFNRCVVFNTTSTSFHGHPDPLRCPEDRTRKSIALYYYTNGRPKDEGKKIHGTLWQARPGEQYADLKAPGWRQQAAAGAQRLLRIFDLQRRVP